MNMNEYAVYGITELETKRIVFISYYIYDWEDMIEYPSIKNYIEDAIAVMQGDDRRNEYWRDLENMYNASKIGDGMGVVVLDVLQNEKDAQYAADYFIDMFKPRYNILDNKCKCGEDCCSSINCQCSCGNHIKF